MAREGRLKSLQDLREAIMYGAVKRIRPKIMTVSVILAGLIPIMFSHGTGADVMKRIAAPMVGGVVTSTILELIIYPAIYMIWRGREFKANPFFCRDLSTGLLRKPAGVSLFEPILCLPRQIVRRILWHGTISLRGNFSWPPMNLQRPRKPEQPTGQRRYGIF